MSLRTGRRMLGCLIRGLLSIGYSGIYLLSVETRARCVPSRGTISGPLIPDMLQVTIWGGSAGGGSVTAQLILNGGEENPPFRAAIPGEIFLSTLHVESPLTVSIFDRIPLVAIIQEPKYFEQPIYRSAGSVKLLGPRMPAKSSLRRSSECLSDDIPGWVRGWQICVRRLLLRTGCRWSYNS
jgi:hypothetical protein